MVMTLAGRRQIVVFNHRRITGHDAVDGAIDTALRHGVAAGAANTLQLGAGSFSAERAQQLLAALPEPA